ncbi:hypothetical protein K2X05_12725, partial [bacterium]|nr:hypothetical protein [bacterium]
MKLFFASILFLAAQAKASDVVQAKQKLNQTDSLIFAEKLEILGKNLITDPTDAKQVFLKSQFLSKDGSIRISCQKTWKAGIYIDPTCEVEMNSVFSAGAPVSQFKIGAIGNVKIAQLYDPNDIANLIKVVNPTSRYASQEKITVLVNGAERILPKFQISCVEVV